MTAWVFLEDPGQDDHAHLSRAAAHHYWIIMTKLLVFVTSELHPFTNGGIGRVIANLLMSLAKNVEAVPIVLFMGKPPDLERFRSLYPHAKLVTSSAASHLTMQEGTVYPPPKTYLSTSDHATSVRAMQALKQISRKYGAPAYVEFPDFMGWAFATCQEKKLGLDFQETCITVRLHSTTSVLSQYEQDLADSYSIARYDLERKSLADCDLVVAQLSTIAEANQSFFDFSSEDWQSRLCIQAPPVLLDHPSAATVSIRPSWDTPIAFTSRMQPFKNPEVFVRGTCGFMISNPDYCGQIIVLAHRQGTRYLKIVFALIPSELRHRFVCLHEATSIERQTTISRSVCIFPSHYESFCLAAYEASLSGATCILNASNPAFGPSTPWLDAENCYKFDGTADGLCDVLTRVFSAPVPLSVVDIPVTPAPWSIPPAEGFADMATSPTPFAMPSSPPTGNNPHAAPMLSVLIPHYNLGRYLSDTVASVFASDYRPIEVIIVDDASSDPYSQRMVAELAAFAHPDIRIVRRTHNAGVSTARNLAVQQARGAYVLTLNANDLLHPAFIGIGVHALEKQVQFDFVVPQASLFHDHETLRGMPSARASYRTFIGEARASGLYANLYAPACVIGRREAMQDLRYDETLSIHAEWDLYQRAVLQGRRFLVTNGCYFHQRLSADQTKSYSLANRAETMHFAKLARARLGLLDTIRVPMSIPTSGFIVFGAGHCFRDTAALLDTLKMAILISERAPRLMRLASKIAVRVSEWHEAFKRRLRTTIDLYRVPGKKRRQSRAIADFYQALPPPPAPHRRRSSDSSTPAE